MPFTTNSLDMPNSDAGYVLSSAKLNPADSVFDYALEDSILECLGKVLSVCMYASRREDLDPSTTERVMFEGNLIYSRLHQMCLDQKDLFFKIYHIAKAFKAKNYTEPEQLMTYEEALEKASNLPNKETVLLAIEFIHNFQDLVKQRLLLVKPLLVNPHETREVFDNVISFINYECVFALE